MRSILALALVVAIGACRPSNAQERTPLLRDELRRELIGCYALFDARGRPVDSSYYNSSPAVRFDSLVAGITDRDTIPGVYWWLHRLNDQGVPLDSPGAGPHAGPVWWADSLSDTIRLSFSTGFSGAEFILSAPRRALDTLGGRAVERWDFGPPFVDDRGGAFAERIACPSSD